MKTKTPKQIHEQWQRIKSYVRTRGHFMEYWRIMARYCNRMADYNGASPYWHGRTGWQYTEQDNAPAPVTIYTKHPE